jgi:hypothetical protein
MSMTLKVKRSIIKCFMGVLVSALVQSNAVAALPEPQAVSDLPPWLRAGLERQYHVQFHLVADVASARAALGELDLALFPDTKRLGVRSVGPFKSVEVLFRATVIKGQYVYMTSFEDRLLVETTAPDRSKNTVEYEEMFGIVFLPRLPSKVYSVVSFPQTPSISPKPPLKK